MFRVSVLGSGSLGNAVLAETAATRVLIDAGFSARRLTERLAALDVDPATLDAVLLSHEHQDHTRGVEILARKHGVPVYCNRMTQRVVAEKMRAQPAWRLIEAGARFTLGDLEVTSFPVPHDAVDPMGFVLESGGHRLGIATDLGHVNAPVRTALRGVRTLVVEANYDQALLDLDARRPWATKQRIASRHGHLSNDQVAQLAVDLAESGLARLVLAHLSRDCNKPETATAAITSALNGSPCEIHCATQEENLGPLPVG